MIKLESIALCNCVWNTCSKTYAVLKLIRGSSSIPHQKAITLMLKNNTIQKVSLVVWSLFCNFSIQYCLAYSTVFIKKMYVSDWDNQTWREIYVMVTYVQLTLYLRRFSISSRKLVSQMPISLSTILSKDRRSCKQRRHNTAIKLLTKFLAWIFSRTIVTSDYQ